MKKVILAFSAVVLLVLGACTSDYLKTLTSPDFVWQGANASTGYTYIVQFSTDRDCQIAMEAPDKSVYIGTGTYNYDSSTGNGLLSVYETDVDRAPARKFYVASLSSNTTQITIDEGGDEAVTTLTKTPNK